ncbi:PAS domain S-box protein [Deinococcus reticulitermitis]|uniref:PAS domain S-box protein n=1 Tax=Deinococcus reticulitermitis TaxID=856736 RepID=UPI003182E934
MRPQPGATLFSGFPGWSRWVAPLVLAAVLLFSIVAAVMIARLTQAQQQARLEREIAAHTGAMRARIDDFGSLLQASRAFWLSQADPPTPERFKIFTSGLGLGTRYPEVQALGFTRWLEPGQTLASASPRPAPVPEVFPAQTSQPYRAVIQYIAPLTVMNTRALGFDMYSEPARRAAIQGGRDTLGVQATSPVKLVQVGPGGEPLEGFLIFMPVWREADGSPATPGQGRLRGFLYVAVRGDYFMQGLQNSFGRDRLTPRLLLGGQPLFGGAALGRTDARTRLSLAGQTWDVAYERPISFTSEPLTLLPPLIALLGLFTAGVAYLLIQGQVTARERAEGANTRLREMQQRQERARAEFEAIFQSMQDAAAFTDDQGRVRLTNGALDQQFGMSPGELTGEPLARLHADRRLDSRSTFQALTTPYLRRDGSQFFGEAQRNEVRGEQGELLGYLEVVRDVSERVSSEQTVRAQERRARAAFDAIPHIVWISDAAGEVTYVNSQHRERLSAAGLRERVELSDLPIYDQMWQRAYTRRASASSTVRIWVEPFVPGGPSPDPERPVAGPRWHEVRVAPLLDDQGQAREWVASATDIHDRLNAERSAQTSEARYRAVVEGMPQIVWLADPQGVETYFNRRWAEHVGAVNGSEGAGDEAGGSARSRSSREDGGGLIAALHPDDRADYQRRWQEALASGQGFEAEHRLRGAGGLYRTFVTRGVPIRGGGQITEWVGTTTDIDDSVYAENAARLLVRISEALSVRVGEGDPLQGRAARYEAALHLIGDWLSEAGAIWLTPGIELLAAVTPHPNWELPHLSDAMMRVVHQVAQTGEAEELTAHPLLHAVSVSGVLVLPLAGRDGTTHGVLALAYRRMLQDREHETILEIATRLGTALDNDLLREQAAEAQLELRHLNQSLEERVRRRTLELEEANQELEAFSYSVSHDLRTPLRHIVGFGDLLRKETGGALGPKGERYLGVITDAAGRMSGLIDSLLEFSRMGRQPMRAGEVALTPLIEQVWQTLEPDRQGRQVSFELGPLPSVPGDAALLELVFQNLLSNALKYTRTREHTRVSVQAEVREEAVTVTVRDNGVGFDPKYTAKLFGVFQRLHRAEDFEGIGIGLANVRRIVIRHGGQVSGESVPGEGAAFHVTLPLRVQERA